MLPLLTILIFLPMLIEFCLLRRGGKRSATCVLAASILSGLLFTFLVFGPTWTVPMADSETARTSSDQAIGLVIASVICTFLFSVVALIPASIFSYLFHRFRGLQR